MEEISVTKRRIYLTTSLLAIGSGVIGGIVSGIILWRIFTGTIPPPEVDRLLSGYLNNSTLRKDLDDTFGGTFPKDMIYSKTDRKVGVRLWFCYNDSTTDYPKVFLAAEKLSSFSFPELNDEPAEMELMAIDASFKTNNINVASPFKDLSKRVETSSVPKIITKRDVIKFSEAFRTLTKNEYKYCFFFFDNTNDFGRFLDQPDHTGAKDVTHIRYYFGYDSGEPVNKIRVILVAVNSKGENIAEEQSIILQKSVPPPPYTK